MTYPGKLIGHVVRMGSAEVINTLISRTFEENLAFIEQDSVQECLYHVKIGFIPNMRVQLNYFI